MEQEEIFAKAKRIISGEMGIPEEEITLESRFTEDLGLDDVQLAETVFVLEEHFGIEISHNDFCRIRTIEQAVNTIESLLTATPNREVV